MARCRRHPQRRRAPTRRPRQTHPRRRIPDTREDHTRRLPPETVAPRETHPGEAVNRERLRADRPTAHRPAHRTHPTAATPARRPRRALRKATHRRQTERQPSRRPLSQVCAKRPHDPPQRTVRRGPQGDSSPQRGSCRRSSPSRPQRSATARLDQRATAHVLTVDRRPQPLPAVLPRRNDRHAPRGASRA